MTYDSKMSNIILRLKEVKAKNQEITIQKISDHTGVSLSTVTRVFADGSESVSFRYDSIRPIAQMLLGLDNLDEGDGEVKGLKAIIQLKDASIKQLKEQYEEEREHHNKKLEKERAQHEKSIEFLKRQIELKDERITLLMNESIERGKQYQELHKQYIETVSQLMKERK